MVYSIKEIFYTLQGEGAQTGMPAVFCRFAGCNLWSGLEKDRATAICNFCDTDFVGVDGEGGGRFATAQDLALAVAGHWPRESGAAKPLVVCTGGEPLLQLDAELVQAFHKQGCRVAIETNGTMEAPLGIDWICVSPKVGTDLRQRTGHELKLIFPQDRLDPAIFTSLSFSHFFIQPKDGPDVTKNTQLAIDYCLKNPQWRLSVQTHKILGLYP